MKSILITILLSVITTVVGAEVDLIGERLKAFQTPELRRQIRSIAQQKQRSHAAVVSKLVLSQQDKKDLVELFEGNEKAAMEFAQGVHRYVHTVRKDLLPSSINFFWILKQIGYAYFKLFMLGWRVIPNSTKLSILKFVATSPFLRKALFTYAPGLMKILFGNLGGALGLGASIVG
ncbi:hypothetical protein M3Y98_00637500 [Aphelenchoides besseyi]|nr:hypothetical protein M3Y98_00637500 [Aphelenchoides besseyi]KAI6208536.1 hypothetical protein M3Y96_00125600 [Aphelenchoides besseyi]